ncbi:hypothetical protein [Rheinheimera oceanensis]|uniref:hypothetical protein n=1 Tax=Rheinheimera oceanensis TaxID=2817449 RepID=UPI001BFD5776|nr:hypothetical protein [Rheinheimera oceanensis]
MQKAINYCAPASLKVFRYWKLLALSCFLTGCDTFSEQYSIEKVRHAYYEEMQQLSIGSAFDSWSLCSERAWTRETTPRGEKHVVFNCTIAPSTLFKVIEFYTPVSKPLKGDEPYLQIQVAKFHVNWLLNNDGSFSDGQGVLTVRWQDGKEDYTAVPLYPLVLQDVYSDNYNFSTAAFGQNVRTYYKNAKTVSN